MYHYIYLVLLVLIFITVYHAYSREGMDNIPPIEDIPQVIDTPMAKFTATESRIPNRIVGATGDDITFVGNLNTEGGNALELGKNVKKGENAGKFRYNEKEGEVQIYGAGREGAPHKIRLNDTVEVGDLLQANRANVRGQLGIGANQEGSFYIDEGKRLAIKGVGAEGERKVKIWDDAEVGKLFASQGVEVKGVLNAYNDLNVEGSLHSKGKMFAQDVSVIGDLDIRGKLTHPRLDEMNASLSQINQRINSVDTDSIKKTIEVIRGDTQGNIQDIKNQTNDSLDSKINLAYSTLRGEINAGDSAIRTNINASFQKVTQDIGNATNTINTSILQSNLRHDGAYSTLDQSLKSAIADIRKENATTIASNFNNLVEQINNASKSSTLTTGTVNTLLAAANSSIASMKAELDATKLSLTNLSDITNRQYLLGRSEVNTSLQNIIEKDEARAFKFGAYDLMVKDWNATKNSLQATTNEWNASKKSFQDTTNAWNAKYPSLQDATNAWNSNSNLLINAATEWNAQKEWLGKRNTFDTVTIGSGNSAWKLMPDPDKLSITKGVSATAVAAPIMAPTTTAVSTVPPTTTTTSPVQSAASLGLPLTVLSGTPTTTATTATTTTPIAPTVPTVPTAPTATNPFGLGR